MPKKESRSLGIAFRNFVSSQQERSKRKDDSDVQGGQPTSSASSAPEPATRSSAEYPPPATIINPSIQYATSVPKKSSIPIPPEQLWDQAYDDLKRDEPKLVGLYESILFRELDGFKGAKGNVIESDRKQRQSQMEFLLHTGLEKTAKLVNVGENVSDIINIVLSVKEAVGSALQAVPIAALAWTGLCVALQRDEDEPGRNYRCRSDDEMVLKSCEAPPCGTIEHNERFAELQGVLADRILDLYKALLKYIIKSVCAYDRHLAYTLLKNSVKLDDWTGSLNDVCKAEEFVKAAASDFGVRQTNSYLGLLVSMQVSEAQDKIMQKLCITDMAAEIESLQKRKDILLADSYKWILNNKDYQDFLDWDSSNTKRLLWIKGDAGKGKTMLLIGIVGELTAQLETHFDQSHLSYFFCQGTDDKLNTATAILRGLIWMLLRQQKSLIRHLNIFKDLGSTLFEARTAFYSLKTVLQSMLEDKDLERAYLVVDALDECRKEEPGLPQLLEFIADISAKNDNVKWLVSSRDEPGIGRILEEHTARTRLSLELNAECVASAVDAYITYKILGLAERYRKAFAATRKPKIHDKLQTVLDKVASELRRKANGTFLWVALVFKQIELCTADKVLERVKEIPSGLYSIYAQMIHQVNDLDDAAECKRVLLTVVNMYRPLHLSELALLADLSELAVHQDIVRHCGLLTIRYDIIYFVHQSAKDYLVKDYAIDDPNSDILYKIFPDGYAKGHCTILSQSLDFMAQTLRRDIYNLQHPGSRIVEVNAPNLDPLDSIRYACVHWVDHLCDIKSGYDEMNIGNNCIYYVFLKEHFLHWLEALSLLRSISTSVLALTKLERFLRGLSNDSQLLNLVRDACRFILFHRWVIEHYPLQIYASALIFSPTHSVIRELFKDDEPDWIITKPIMESNWRACLQILEGHTDVVNSVAFSTDGTRLASASGDTTVRLWDATTGATLQTLKGHTSGVISVAFSTDGTRLASASYDSTVRLWDATTGAALQTLEGHTDVVNSVAFSTDGTRLASASWDIIVRLWDATTGAVLQTLEGHTNRVNLVAFSTNGTWLASASYDNTIRLWDATTGAALQTLEGHTSGVTSVAFSTDGIRLASASWDNTIRLWDATTGTALQTLEGHTDGVTSVAFSTDGTQLVSASWDNTVQLWDVTTGTALQTLKGHTDRVDLVAFSVDGTQLVSASWDKTIRLWDATTGTALQTLKGHRSGVTSVAFSIDGIQLASASYDNTIRLWDITTGTALQTLEGHASEINSIAFSVDDTQLASASWDSTVRLWDATTGAVLQTLEGHTDGVTSVAFSADGTRLASAYRDNTIRLWDTTTGTALQTLEGHASEINSIAFSVDGTQLASASWNSTVRLWDATTGAVLQTLKGHTMSLFGSYPSFDFNSSSFTVGDSLYSLRENGSWIAWNDENMLWLPQDYRSQHAIVKGHVFITINFGRVVVIKCKEK